MTPGEAIKKRLSELGWTQRDFATVLGRPLPKVNDILNGRTGITPETAVQLATAFGDQADDWMRVESAYRLSLVSGDVAEGVAQRAKMLGIAPVKDMLQRGWLERTDSPEELEGQLRLFFGTDDLEEPPELAINAHKSAPEAPMTPVQRAWCFRAWNLASIVSAERYSEARFSRGLEELSFLTAWPESVAMVPKVLAGMGVRFLVVEPLPRTGIDGVAFWLNSKSPVIAMSCRFDRIDNFWHVLGHELSHIRHKDALHVDVEVAGEESVTYAEMSPVELRANRESSDSWLSQDELNKFVARTKPLYSRAKINKFASRMKVHPGIIVGHLQYRGEIGWQSMRPCLEKVRSHITKTALTDGWGHSISLND